jgi:hypothetical protein
MQQVVLIEYIVYSVERKYNALSLEREISTRMTRCNQCCELLGTVYTVTKGRELSKSKLTGDVVMGGTKGGQNCGASQVMEWSRVD